MKVGRVAETIEEFSGTISYQIFPSVCWGDPNGADSQDSTKAMKIKSFESTVTVE